MEGEKIYYTGDMANPSGWFRVTRDTVSTVDLTEIDGDRVILGIYRKNIGQTYAGHCGTRFVTEAAYQAHRDACMASYVKWAESRKQS